MCLGIECLDGLDGGDGADEMACCVRQVCLLEVDVSLHSRSDEGDDDDDDGEGGEDDEGQ
jgi:hypothetical protein